MAEKKKPVAVVPLGDRVLVRREEPPDRVGNVLIPESARKKVARGVVVAVGQGEMPPGWAGGPVAKELPNAAGVPTALVVDEPSLVGRMVCFSEYVGTQLPDDLPGSELLVMLRSDEVAAVLE